jgi:hypothetical protein
LFALHYLFFENGFMLFVVWVLIMAVGRYKFVVFLLISPSFLCTDDAACPVFRRQLRIPWESHGRINPGNLWHLFLAP